MVGPPAATPDRPVAVPGAGLILRPYADHDAADLMLAFADPDIRRWNPGPGSPTEAASRKWLEGRNNWSVGDHASWAIAGPDERLQGSVSLHKVDWDQGDAEVGYWVAPWARGAGLAGRAVTAATAYAFGELMLHRLYLFHAVDNSGSCRVADAAGFPLEGVLRQSYRYPDGDYHDEHLHGRLASDPR
jgi:RimJ/RimL family protein N-acetyltransferase